MKGRVAVSRGTAAPGKLQYFFSSDGVLKMMVVGDDSRNLP